MSLRVSIICIVAAVISVPVNAYPDWVLNHTPNQASGCSQITNGNLPLAKRVALIKARRTLIENESVTITAESTLTESDSKQEFIQAVKTHSKGNAGIKNLPIEQGKYWVKDKLFWCVLIE